MAKPQKINCKACGKSFYRSIGRVNENVKLGQNFYCTKTCQYQTKLRKNPASAKQASVSETILAFNEAIVGATNVKNLCQFPDLEGVGKELERILGFFEIQLKC